MHQGPPEQTRVKVSGLTLLTIVAVGAALYWMADLLVPVTFSLLLYFLLVTPVNKLERLGVPPALSAALLMLGIAALVISASSVLVEPAEEWLAEAPRSVRELRQQFRDTEGPIATIEELAEEVDQIGQSENEPQVREVVVSEQGVFELLLGGLPTVIAAIGIVTFLTYFLLASGNGVFRRIAACGRNWRECRRLYSISNQIRRDLSRYLATVTVINAALGACVAVAMYLLDVPNPVLWGAMVYLFNFAPYVGALTSASIFFVVGFTEFDTLSASLSVPLVFLTLTIIEGQLVTPLILGRRMSLNPVFVFLTVVLWGWLWGVAGALMAVPILIGFSVVCERTPSLRILSVILAGEVSTAGLGRRSLTGDAEDATTVSPRALPRV